LNDLTGRPLATARMFGAVPTSTIGARSRAGSYGSFA
jgi:hypothetical protein